MYIYIYGMSALLFLASFPSASWFQGSSNVVPFSNTLLLLLEYFTIVVFHSMYIPHFLYPFIF